MYDASNERCNNMFMMQQTAKNENNKTKSHGTFFSHLSLCTEKYAEFQVPLH